MILLYVCIGSMSRNMLSSVDGEGNTVRFCYDLNGNMTTRTDRMRNSEHFRYDRENRLVSMTDRNGTATRIVIVPNHTS